MSDPVAEALRELRREYHADGPRRVEELRSGLAELSAGHDGAETSLSVLLHRLAGSGGAYGFPQVSTIARALERLVRSEPHWTPARLAEVQAGIEEMSEAFNQNAPD